MGATPESVRVIVGNRTSIGERSQLEDVLRSQGVAPSGDLLDKLITWRRGDRPRPPR